MAFHVFFQLVQNPTLSSKATPWQCDKCRKKDKALLKVSVDYDVVVLCKKCLLEGKKLITERDRELKNEDRIRRTR